MYGRGNPERLSEQNQWPWIIWRFYWRNGTRNSNKFSWIHQQCRSQKEPASMRSWNTSTKPWTNLWWKFRNLRPVADMKPKQDISHASTPRRWLRWNWAVRNGSNMKAVIGSEGGVGWSHGIFSRDCNWPAANNQQIRAGAKPEGGVTIVRRDSKTSWRPKGRSRFMPEASTRDQGESSWGGTKGVATTGRMGKATAESVACQTSTEKSNSNTGKAWKKGNKTKRFDAKGDHWNQQETEIRIIIKTKMPQEQGTETKG